MKSINSFAKGMNNDVSKIIHTKDSYLEAINFRPFTELGESNGSLVNIKGNQCQVKFPQVRSVYKLKINVINPAVFTDTITITVNGQTTGNIVINNNTTGEDIYNALLALNNAYNSTNVTPVTATFMVAWKDDYVVITQQPVYTTCTPTSSVASTIVVTTAATNTVYYVKPDNTTQAGNTPYIDLSAGYGVIPIGSTFIIDDIYVFTAIDDPAYTVGPPEIPVNDTFTKAGQIWKLVYDEVALTSTLTLLYNGYLDFTKYHPIAPTAATARYESANIQRIYWSDFYNKVRTANIGDPQLMALNPILMTIIPSVGFDVPIAQAIPSGSLGAGTYELCYRLKQSLGAISNYSQPSFPVSLSQGTLHSGWIPDFVSTEGSASGTATGKAITWKISNIDTKFDIIEYIILYRPNQTDIAQVYSILEEPIPSSGTKTITVSSLNDAVPIPLQEFLALSSTFTHAKTVDTKDNRLFWGNVKNKTSEISFDARAFRALTTNGGGLVNNDDIKLKHDGLFTTYTSAQAQNETTNPKTNDSINEYYVPSTGIFSADACYYKPNAAYSAGGRPILGGVGANISYEFGTYSHILDIQEGVSNSDDSYNIYNTVPFRFPSSGVSNFTLINSITNSASDNQVHQTESGIDTVKHPLRESILRGFQHEEIYRFGFQAYDLEGNPYFTEWIGDIKMPTFADYNNNPDATALSILGAANADFRTSYMASGNNVIYGQTLYVKFTIDVSSIKDIISGYRIVRVDRSDIEDKTILACGAVTSTYSETGQSDTFLPACFNQANVLFPTPAFPVGAITLGAPWRPAPNQESWETLSLNSLSGGNDQKRIKTFDSFDFKVDGIGFSSGDRLFIRSRIDSVNFNLSLTGGNNRGYRKWFDGTNWYGLTNTLTLRPGNGASGSGAGLAPGFGAFDGTVARLQSGLDDGEMAYYLHEYYTGTSWTRTSDLAANSTTYNRTVNDAAWIGGNLTHTFGSGAIFNNWGATFDGAGTVITGKPCLGAATYVMEFSSDFEEYDVAYGCNAANNGGKILALYYRPNANQYGGNTYTARANNEYIACGSYIPIVRDNIILETTPEKNTVLTIDTFGGDVYTTYWDHQKCMKGDDSGVTYGPTFQHYRYTPASGNAPGDGAGALLGLTSSEANVSVTYFLPCTTFHNAEVRAGDHINTQLQLGWTKEDEDLYYSYHSNQSNVAKYYPKPSIFVNVNEWENRIYYSEVKFNNELQDSWQAYKTDNFYDVEGNYGAIYSLVSLKENLHFIQERGFGYLMVNPITTISGDNGLPVTLGKGDTVEKHRYLALDVGTTHQWSVSKSTNSLTFLDVRSKKIYNFNGESLNPVSDTLGQRNFVIKRMHNTIITTDNPVIGKGVMSTYDYFNNEFLYTFKNNTPTPDATNDENYTIAYSEPLRAFTGLYTFMPILYINNHRNMYSISSTDPTRCWLHNKGAYGNFYGTQYVSSIKSIINDNPKYTKVFNNLSWQTESIDDNTEWRDDLLIPSVTTSQTYSDNVNNLTDTFKRVRCYNEYQNTDYITLSTTPITGNLRKVEQQWNIQNFRNKVDYDTFAINTFSIFDPTVLVKVLFGERMRDKYMIVDLEYDNLLNNRFIVHTLESDYLISDR